MERRQISVDIPISQSHRDQYRKEGFFVLESVLSEAHLNLLRTTASKAVQQMEAQMDREGTDTLGINHRGKRYFVGQTYADHPELGEFIFSDLMADICRATFGDTAYFHSDQFVIKCGETGMSFSWHQDGAYVKARIGDHTECITCWCTLDDVNETNGTVYILPASRFGKRELVDHVRDPQTNDRIGYHGDDPGDPIIASAGSIAVFSSLVFHRSGANLTGQQRRVYLAQYAPEAIRNKAGEWPQYFAEPFIKDGKALKR
ncbi:MAG: phytanoyl-CoA dioxygenase family protein [Verrucomicrobia bacterium]|nr:phytanoyl-CoA dioxygenase family protein [Verrucomicrobiota bacterium]MDA1067434.1 phytanoyl-CoA dioxygenase family protein [Verrucomicrobiota bacterium]